MIRQGPNYDSREALKERLLSLRRSITNNEDIRLNGTKFRCVEISKGHGNTTVTYQGNSYGEIRNTIQALDDKTDLELEVAEVTNSAYGEPNVTLRFEYSNTDAFSYNIDWEDNAAEGLRAEIDDQYDPNGELEPEFIGDGLLKLMPKAGPQGEIEEAGEDYDENVPIEHAQQLADKYQDGSNDYGRGWLKHNEMDDE